MKIEDVEPGSIVYVPAIRAKGFFIGKRIIVRDGIEHYCIGFHQRPDSDVGWVLLRPFENNAPGYDSIWYEEANECVYAWWIVKGNDCELIHSSVKPIQDEKQICVDCKMSAPHAKSNLPDNKFICSFCKMIKDLGV